MAASDMERNIQYLKGVVVVEEGGKQVQMMRAQQRLLGLCSRAHFLFEEQPIFSSN